MDFWGVANSLVCMDCPCPTPSTIADLAAGVDMPGVGHVPLDYAALPTIVRGSPYVAGEVPLPLRPFVEGVELGRNLSQAETAADVDDRDQLMVQLLFAARDLAKANLREKHSFAPAEWQGKEIVVAECRECCMQSVRGDQPHTLTCRTGRVLRILDELGALAKDASISNEKEAALAGETGPAGDGIHTRGEFGEPWDVAFFDKCSDRVSGTGYVHLVDREHTFIAAMCSASPRENLDWALRIVACVNFFAANPALFSTIPSLKGGVR